MRGLYLVGSYPGPPPARDSWSLPSYDLTAQPQRPGELCCELRLAERELAAEAEKHAAATGVPTALWATVAVEATRCLTPAAGVLGVPRSTLNGWLDDAAAATDAAKPGRTPGCRLLDYAQALQSARPRPAGARIGPLLLRPSETTLAAWWLAATEASLTLEAWCAACLRTAAPGAMSWEAAAALGGQTIGEWLLAQALRRLRAARTLAHTAG